jgi:hypothetical protein
VAQVVDPEFKPQHNKKRKKRKHNRGTGGVAQGVDCLPNKHGALSSSSSTATTTKNQGKAT